MLDFLGETPMLVETSNSVILDTCVLADTLIADRPRHQLAVKLCLNMKSTNKRGLVPAHAYFELLSALFSDSYRKGAPLVLGQFGKSLPVELDIADINLRFIESHLVEQLSLGVDLNSSGGDMVFLALALGQKIPLITEDSKLKAKANSIGINVFSVEEYLFQSK